MQQELEAAGDSERPLWRRIADYPLVALVIAVVLYIVAVAVGIALRSIPLPIGSDWNEIVHAIVEICLVLAVYKFVIIRLGEHRRDDLPAHHALRNLGLGLAAGCLIFSTIVGLAALVGVYRITGGGDASRLVLELVGTSIMPGFMEEMLFRGILFRWLEEFGGSWAALVLTSALFGLAHIMKKNARQYQIGLHLRIQRQQRFRRMEHVAGVFQKAAEIVMMAVDGGGGVTEFFH